MSLTISESVHKNLNVLLNTYPLVTKIISSIIQQSGQALLVGGAVRDLLLNIPVKDLDIEVYNLSLDQLESILKKYGPVRLVGKAFGVLRVDGLDVDWSLPRSDAAGRKPHVTIDPHLHFKQAFARRDLTINAMGIDLQNYTLIDPFNGLHDLQHTIARAPNTTFFVEDPLRLFRVMQFIGRFDLQPDAALNAVCASMNIADVSRERIADEMQKLLLKSVRPSLGLRWLDTIQRLQEVASELFALIAIPQRADYHPEGNVFEHTMQAVDAAALIAPSLSTHAQKLILLYAALCHDLGKAKTTVLRDGIWRSPGHAQAGVPLARNLLTRFGINQSLIKTISKLVYYHMAIGEFIRGGARLCRYKHLAYKLSPDTHIQMLAYLSMADRRGRNEKSHLPNSYDDAEVVQFTQRAQEAGVLYEPEKPLVQASDLLDTVAPGPQLGGLLERAYTIQLDNGITNKQELLQRLLIQ